MDVSEGGELSMEPEVHNAVVTQTQTPRVTYHITGDVTPTCIRLDCVLISHLPTGSLGKYRVEEPLVELFEAAHDHVSSMAVLPGDEAADAVVDRLMRRRVSTKRALPRK